MNPGSSETSGLNLPPPVGEPLSVPVGGTESQPAAPERGPAGPERNTRVAQAAPATMPAIPLPLPTAASTTVAVAGATPHTSSAQLAASLADDGDLIEKEWVNKAKAIVERTRNDPHKQSQELTVVKADYMKQRYDKTIKVKP